MDGTAFMAAGIPAPIPCWLTLQAIRFATRVTDSGIPFSFMACRPDPLPELPLPSYSCEAARYIKRFALLQNVETGPR
jgi:hypothetical protein